MYSIGETFYYDFEDEKYELTVLKNFNLDDVEYIIAEDFDGRHFAFYYDENEDEVKHISDSHDEDSVISYWKEEYFLDDEINDFEENEYYDREDGDYFEKYDSFHEVEDEDYF